MGTNSRLVRPSRARQRTAKQHPPFCDLSCNVTLVCQVMSRWCVCHAVTRVTVVNQNLFFLPSQAVLYKKKIIFQQCVTLLCRPNFFNCVFNVSPGNYYYGNIENNDKAKASRICSNCSNFAHEFKVPLRRKFVGLFSPNSVLEYRVVYIFTQKTEQETVHPNIF